MTDYTALADTALTEEGTETYFGELAEAAVAAAEITRGDLTRILAETLAAHSVPTDIPVDIPDAVVTDCTQALRDMLPTYTYETAAEMIGCTVADIDALITGDGSDSFGHALETGRLDLAEIATLTDAVAQLADYGA